MPHIPDCSESKDKERLVALYVEVGQEAPDIDYIIAPGGLDIIQACTAYEAQEKRKDGALWLAEYLIARWGCRRPEPQEFGIVEIPYDLA